MESIIVNFDYSYYQKCFTNFQAKNTFYKTFEKALKSTILKGLEEIYIETKIKGFKVYYKHKEAQKIQNEGLLVNTLLFDIYFPTPVLIKDIKIGKPFPCSTIRNGVFIAQKKENGVYVQIDELNFSPLFFQRFSGLETCKCIDLKEYIISGRALPLIFICKNCGKLYICECQRKYYEKIAQNYTCANDFYMGAHYKAKICHLCTGKVPDENYIFAECSKFAYRYYPYIEAIREYIHLNLKNTPNDNLNYSQIRRNAENYIRNKVGYPLIGEKWVNETVLYKICREIFPNSNVIREYSPKWLNKQRIDIFIKDYNVGIEYQGEQHFRPIEYFGGEEAMLKCQERDLLKAKLCQANGLTLIYFNYTEDLTVKSVKNKLARYIKL